MKARRLMLRSLKVFSFGLVLALVASARSAAAAPDLMGYSARLYDAKGTPINGTHRVTVRIFRNGSGGAELYSQVFAKTDVTDGYFYVALNEFDDIETLFNDDDRFLEVEIDGEVLEPRQQMGAVPWALGGAAASPGPGLPTDCSGGQFAAWDPNDKKWICSAPTSSSPNLPTGCTAGQVAAWDQTSRRWSCSTPTSSGGVSLPTCTEDGRFAKWSGGQWICEAIATSGSGGSGLATPPTCTGSGKLQWTGGASGSWSCEADVVGPSGVICASNQKPSWNSTSSVWACAAEDGDITEIAAGLGISTSSNTLSGRATISIDDTKVLTHNKPFDMAANGVNAQGVLRVTNTSSTGSNRIGLSGSAVGEGASIGGVPSSDRNVGVGGSAQGAGSNYGVLGAAKENRGSNYGVAGIAQNGPGGNVGIFGFAPGGYAGLFEGDVRITGKLTVGQAEGKVAIVPADFVVPSATWGEAWELSNGRGLTRTSHSQNSQMVAAIRLPDRAQLSTVTCWTRDSHEEHDFVFQVIKRTQDIELPVGDAYPSGTWSGKRVDMNWFESLPAVVTDASTGAYYSYELLVTAHAESGELNLYSCSAEYTIPSR